MGSGWCGKPSTPMGLLKEEAENAIVNTLQKLFQTFSEDTRDQQVSAHNHSFITVIQSYDCKQTSVGFLYFEKMDDVVSLNVFTKGLPASPFLVVHVHWTLSRSMVRELVVETDWSVLACFWGRERGTSQACMAGLSPGA